MSEPMITQLIKTDPPVRDLYMRYLGVLGLLGECSVYVPDYIRESIERAFANAVEHHPLQWRRVIDRITIEPKI